MSAGTPRPSLDRAHRILLETARQLGSSLEPQAIFTRLLDSVCGVMRCDGLIVSSFDRPTNVIRCDYAWVGGNVLDPATLPPLTFRPDGQGMQSQVLRTGRPMLFADIEERVRDPQGTYYEVAPDGSVRNLRESGPPKSRSAMMVPLLLEGEVTGVIQVMADVERAYTSADLEMLEGFSLLLAIALENARLYRRAHDELEERTRAERRKDEFLATLSHELRNPLNPLRNAVELLRRKKINDPDVRWSQDVIQRQVLHLSRLIDDLLDVSRITEGKLELRREVVSLDDILDGASEAVRPLMDPMKQRLVVRRPGEPVALNADRVRLGQVFLNLLDNAAKYSPAEARIDISVERRDAEVVVSVRDQGIGIAPEHLPHVFDSFFQADRSIGKTHGGLGIGLTLVKRLVELHGGSIEAHSEGLACGSEFVVSLPVMASHPNPGGTPDAATKVATPSRSRRVLVADDNRDSAETMATLLRLSGNEVEVAFDGEEAVRLAEDFRPEVVVLDIGMPRLDGYQVAEQLRTRPWARSIQLIAVTGWGKEQDRQKSKDSGFDAHLVKPVDSDSLIRLMQDSH